MKIANIKTRIIATILTVMIIAGLFNISVMGWQSSGWAEESVIKAGETGLIPDSLKNADLTLPVSRAGFAAVAVKLYENLTGTEVVYAGKNPFTDTNDAEVLKAYGLGVTNGVAADRFDPDSPLTREMAATMLTRVWKKYIMPDWTFETDGNFTLSYKMPELFLDDAQISDWAKNSVYFMSSNEIVYGMGENKFVPRPADGDETTGLVTGEQALMIAMRIIDNLVEDPIDWAWDIFMAQNVYNLGGENIYKNLEESFAWGEFIPVYDSLAEKLGIDAYGVDTRETDLMTRDEIIIALYAFIVWSLDIENPALITAFDYFVTNGLIEGRFNIKKTCTVEEMLGLSVRVYEYIIHELGFESTGFFWQVTGGKNTVYLLGSVHIGESEMYPLNNKIEKAFDSSSHLVLERDFDSDTQADHDYYYDKAIIKNGKTIKDYLDPEIYEIYALLCEVFGFEPDFYNYIYPWYAWLEVLSNIESGIILAGDDFESVDDIYDSYFEAAILGIDYHFEFKSVFQDKDIIGLETAKSRADMLSSFSPELQEELLVEEIVYILYLLGFFDDMTEDPDDTPSSDGYYDLFDIWKRGDEKALIEMNGIDVEIDDPLFAEFNYKMLTERNYQMFEKILKFLTSGEGDYFVVVGAAHMVGSDGLVKLLTDAGYTVERIK